MCRDSDLKYVCYADPNLAPELAKASSDQIHELTRKTGGFRHALADGLDATVATKILQLSSFGVSFYLFPKRQTRIYDASIVLAVIPAMVATNAPARVQRVFLTLTVIK